MKPRRPLRIVLAKLGLDGHDRGIKVVARGLRDAGFHVIYSGLWQPVEAVVQAVADEDADFLGVSLLSGAHRTLTPRLMDALRSAGLQHVGVILGGIIPEADVPELLQLGILQVFGPGTSLPEIASYLESVGNQRRAEVDAAALRQLVQQMQSGDRLALARLLTLAADPEHGDVLRRELRDPSPANRARMVALTGHGGVGKSTLIGRLIALLRQQGKTVAVLACDPQSPLTGGALLGDRIRMSAGRDAGVFIRSIPISSGEQAVAAGIDVKAHLLAQFGFDVVLIETAGAGQADTAVRQVAPVLVLLVQPEAGDELQWEKAGLMELADVVALNKSDLPGADRTESQLRDALSLSSRSKPRIVRLSSTRNEGIEELWSAISEQGSTSGSHR